MAAAEPRKRRKAKPKLGRPSALARRRGDASYAGSEGFRELTWGGFDALARQLTKKLDGYDPELVIGIVKGGLFVGSAVAGLLRREFIPVRLSRRSRDRERLTPGVRTEVPPEAKGKRVLVVDDVVQSGETLRHAVAAVAAGGAEDVRSAALVVHRSRPGDAVIVGGPEVSRGKERAEARSAARSKANRPDWYALETDDLVVFPWDYELRGSGTGEQDPGESGA